MVIFFSLWGALCLFLCTPGIAQTKERLSLNEAIEIAVEHNPQISESRIGVEAARGRFWRGIAPPPASLTLGYDYIPVGGGIRDYGERSVGVSQSFEFPTTTVLRGSTLSYETDAAESDLSSTILSLSLQVKLAYYGLLAKQQKFRLAEENLGIAEDFAHKAGIRYEVGEGTNLEHLTAKLQRTQAENAVEIARNDLMAATSELNFALGRGKDQSVPSFELTDSLTHTIVIPLLDTLIWNAQRWNPQLRSASFRLSAASINRTIAWSSFLPSFSVSYSRQVQAGNANLFGVAFGLSLPIWFLLDQNGQIQEASATYAMLQSDLTSRQNFAAMDVTNSFLEFKNNERQVRLYVAEWLPQANEVYRAAVTSYQAGEITYIEFLQAKQTLISARNSYIDALYGYHAAVARLEQAVGRTIGD